MEKKLMLPANYNVMNEEEMTYTSGGDGFTAPFAVGWTIGAVISVANLIWGYMGKSIGNAIVGVYTALNLTGWWPVTAIAWVTA